MRLDHLQKCDILYQLRNDINGDQIAQEYNVSKSTISRIKNFSRSIPKVFRYAVRYVKSELHRLKTLTISDSIFMGSGAAQAAVYSYLTANHNASSGLPKIIPLPKTNDIRSLIPIFACLSAFKVLTDGMEGILEAVVIANKAKRDFKKLLNHQNQSMEAITMGNGLFLKPYKNGLALYLE